MTLANPTTEPAEDANRLLREAASLIEALPLGDALSALVTSRTLLDATETRILGRQIKTGVGTHQIRQIIKETTGNSNREAAQTVRRAEAVNQIPDVIAKMETGELSTGQVDLVVKAINETSAETVAGSDIIERIQEATVDQGRGTVKSWITETNTDEDLTNRHARHRANREFGFFTADDGMVGISGLLPPLIGAEIRSQVKNEANRIYQAEGGRDLDSHPTTRAQRYADAFTNVMLGQTSPGTTPGRPAIIVTVTADRVAGMEGAPPAELVGSGPLPDDAVNELAERSDILGMVFKGNGQPLWLGRRKRLASDAQFIAAMARDRGCATCSEMHDEMVVHHTVPYSAPARGKTDIDNLAMLGVGCHTTVHATQQRLVWDPVDKQWGSRLARPDEQARARGPSNGASSRHLAQSRGEPRHPATDHVPPPPAEATGGEVLDAERGLRWSQC